MTLNVPYNLKLKMQKGEAVFGQTIGPANDPEKTVKALKDFGFDFIIMEGEHSLLNKETIFEYIRASRKFDIPILLRPEDKTANFRCYLDAGVNGLMIPQIDTVEEVVHIVDQSYFPPMGNRGQGIGMSPYLLDSQNFAEMPILEITEYVNNNVILFPQTETLQSISYLPRILKLDGVTGTIVGPNDLVLSIGNIPPKATRSEMAVADIVEEKLRQIVRICRAAGKVAGMGGLSPKGYAKWAKEGYQLFLMGFVIDGNVDSLRPRIEELKSLIG